MSFGSILYALLIQPLQIFFELVYGFADTLIENKGLSIIVLSLAINFLVLPLYRRADAMQEDQRLAEERLAAGVEHIKKTFKGDERMMMLQTYYRQNNYKPTHALKGAAPLLLQIPFFIAAYRFLSSMTALQGVSFGLIDNLYEPDGLLKLFGLNINILPFAMTFVNLISSYIYSRKYPLKTKLQLFLTALFFLAFLYNSPSGLVFYWTLNNVFSLLKTIVLKLKNPKKATFIIFSASGGMMLIAGLVFGGAMDEMKMMLLVFAAFLAQLPLIFSFLIGRINKSKPKVSREYTPNRRMFLAGSLFMAVLTGVIIPSNVIKSSPQEFISSTYYQHPVWYIVYATALAIGTFVIWFSVFYYFSSNKARTIFGKAVVVMSGASLVSYMGFSHLLGLINSDLTYDNGLSYTIMQSILNFGAVIVAGAILLLLLKKFSKQVVSLIFVCVLAFSCMGVVNIVSINSSISKVTISDVKDNEFNIPLSKDGKNVVVIMIDRAMGLYAPYIFNEKPELKEQFSGFTYYSNVISYGRSTIFGSPALFGGYEYTPIEINTRKDELLLEKQNECLKVMPALFSENGYDVTVCNPVFTNYQWIPDLTIFDDYDNVKSYYVESLSFNEEDEKAIINNNCRNFFIHSLMLSSPTSLQEILYDRGVYYKLAATQMTYDCHTAIGNRKTFMDSFSVIQNLSKVTNVSSSSKGNVLIMSNGSTHEPQLLQEPDYLPADKVDNREYDAAHMDRFTLNGVTLNMDRVRNYTLYEVNAGVMLQLGNWFDYLKELGVYDNTKIILVADHGYALEMGGTCDEMIMDADAPNDYGDAASYFPLLMVKDFDSDGFTVSDEFMTNADVPAIAFDGTVNNPVNPFTNNPINSDEKLAHDQYIIASMDLEITDNVENKQFTKARWYKVHDSIWDKDNWSVVADDAILTKNDVK